MYKCYIIYACPCRPHDLQPLPYAVAPRRLQYASAVALPESDPYHPWEQRWLNKPDTIPRYMRAAKWNQLDAQKRIKSTLEWRREFKPDIIPPEEVRIESETGKM